MALQCEMSAFYSKRTCAETALVERATESRDSDSHRKQHQDKHRDCIVVQVGKVRAFEHDRAYNSYVMRERQRLTDPLCPDRHARERKYKSGQKDVGQEEHHRHLHGLQLILCHGRERVANRQIGGDEQRT